ncbi:MAG: hypothetical protein JWO85_677 [Candidatus Eremiobacteraeota bacterium]|nr:hypothetical protein [Candidatus Eremiobacteraeota bacterium]
MMFEDMLTYHPGTPLNQPFSELLAADLDDDARRFYARMASDIGVAATGMHRLPQAPAIVRVLLKALVAAPAARAGCWRHLYRNIAALVAGCDSATPPDALRVGFVRALGRLRGFLSENADIAHGLALEDLDGTVVGRSARA